MAAGTLGPEGDLLPSGLGWPREKKGGLAFTFGHSWLASFPWRENEIQNTNNGGKQQKKIKWHNRWNINIQDKQTTRKGRTDENEPMGFRTLLNT